LDDIALYWGEPIKAEGVVDWIRRRGLGSFPVEANDRPPRSVVRSVDALYLVGCQVHTGERILEPAFLDHVVEEGGAVESIKAWFLSGGLLGRGRLASLLFGRRRQPEPYVERSRIGPWTDLKFIERDGVSIVDGGVDRPGQPREPVPDPSSGYGKDNTIEVAGNMAGPPPPPTQSSL
jgi:hypothetical protein